MRGKTRNEREHERGLVLAELVLLERTTIENLADELVRDGVEISPFTVSRYLIALKKMGLAEMRGTPKRRVWVATEASLEVLAREEMIKP